MGIQLNRIKTILIEKNKTNKWLADKLAKNTATVSRWCTEGTLKCFYICNRIKIPKEYLTDFLASERGVKVVRKSDKHLDILLAFFDYMKEHKKKNELP